MKDNPESLKAYLVHCEKVLQIKTQCDIEMQKQRDNFNTEMQKQRDQYDLEDKRIKNQFWEKVLSVTGNVAEAYIENHEPFDPDKKIEKLS